MFRSRILLATALGSTLAACTVGPNYKPATPAELGVPGGYSVNTPARTADDITHWWTGFDDPMLAQLVVQSQTTNLDIAQAVARLKQAHEALIQSRAQLLPQVTGSAGYNKSFDVTGASTVTLPDGTITTISRGAGQSFSLGADVSYQVGLFGEVRRTVEASKARYESSGYDYATVLLSTESEVARNYVLARLYQAQLANANDSLKIQDDNLQIAGWRVQAGLVSSVDQEQARAARAQTAAGIPMIENFVRVILSRVSSSAAAARDAAANGAMLEASGMSLASSSMRCATRRSAAASACSVAISASAAPRLT